MEVLRNISFNFLVSACFWLMLSSTFNYYKLPTTVQIGISCVLGSFMFALMHIVRELHRRGE